jgi:hypothetical protein
MRVLTYGMGGERVSVVVRQYLPAATVESSSDYQAAMDIKSGKADAAIGVCQSGAGGALAVPRALLGPTLCAQLSTPSRQPTKDEIGEAVAQGKKVFGLAMAHLEASIPHLAAALDARAVQVTGQSA